MCDFETSQGCSYGQLSVGKSLWLLPTERGWGWLAWHHLIRLFEFWRNFIFSLSTNSHYCILSIIIILYTKQACSAVGIGAFGKGYRTWVRIPGPPNYFILFFFQWSDACTGGMTTMVHHYPTIQVSRWPDLKAIRWRSTKGLGQSKAWDLGSQTWVTFFWAQIASNAPPNYS